MGKRKSSRKPVSKPKARLATVFNCLFCNHEKSVEVKMERSKQIGTLKCRICQESWQTSITGLSDPVDVFSEWLDACEAAQKDTEAERTSAQRAANGDRAPPQRHEDDHEDHFGDGLDDDELDDAFYDRRDAARTRHLLGMNDSELAHAADGLLEEELI